MYRAVPLLKDARLCNSILRSGHIFFQVETLKSQSHLAIMYPQTILPQPIQILGHFAWNLFYDKHNLLYPSQVSVYFAIEVNDPHGHTISF